MTLFERFKELADSFEEETRFVSSDDEMARNRFYKAIIGLGPEAVPVLIEDLKRTGRPWFHVLTVLTGENPVKENHRGVTDLMIKDWCEWEKTHE